MEGGEGVGGVSSSDASCTVARVRGELGDWSLAGRANFVPDGCGELNCGFLPFDDYPPSKKM